MKSIFTKLASFALARALSAPLGTAPAPAKPRSKETRPAQGKNARVGTNKEMGPPSPNLKNGWHRWSGECAKWSATSRNAPARAARGVETRRAL